MPVSTMWQACILFNKSNLLSLGDPSIFKPFVEQDNYYIILYWSVAPLLYFLVLLYSPALKLYFQEFPQSQPFTLLVTIGIYSLKYIFLYNGCVVRLYMKLWTILEHIILNCLFLSNILCFVREICPISLCFWNFFSTLKSVLLTTTKIPHKFWY